MFSLPLQAKRDARIFLLAVPLSLRNYLMDGVSADNNAAMAACVSRSVARDRRVCAEG
jgi:hypothetical protein